MYIICIYAEYIQYRTYNVILPVKPNLVSSPAPMFFVAWTPARRCTHPCFACKGRIICKELPAVAHLPSTCSSLAAVALGFETIRINSSCHG